MKTQDGSGIEEVSSGEESASEVGRRLNDAVLSALHRYAGYVAEELDKRVQRPQMVERDDYGSRVYVPHPLGPVQITEDCDVLFLPPGGPRNATSDNLTLRQMTSAGIHHQLRSAVTPLKVHERDTLAWFVAQVRSQIEAFEMAIARDERRDERVTVIGPPEVRVTVAGMQLCSEVRMAYAIFPPHVSVKQAAGSEFIEAVKPAATINDIEEE